MRPAGLSVGGWPCLANRKVSPMHLEKIGEQQTDHMPLDFPLSLMKPLLDGFSAPVAAFDPRKAWKARYLTYCLVGNVKVPTGFVALDRTSAGGGYMLRLRCERSAGKGRVHRLDGEVSGATDELATPREWRATGDAAGARGTRLRSHWNGSAEKLSGKLSHQWSLLDAIQRMPQKPFPKLSFQYITYDGALLPRHTLAYRGAVEIQTGQGPLRLHGYEQLGGGILPWIYYTGDSGRLLIAVSGLEAWLFDGAAI